MRREVERRRQVIRRDRATRASMPLVEGVEPRVFLATFIVTNTTDTTATGSLRWAIGQSDAAPGSNTIDFNIAGSGAQTIAITSALPAVTVPVTIDGTSQPGYARNPLIELNGSGAGSGADGLDLSAGSTTVEGLAIDRFAGEGISLSAAGSDTIRADFIGTNPAGTAAEGNGKDGIFVQVNSDSNTISTDLISGNATNGIELDADNFGRTGPVTSGNLVVGNAIGTDVTGTKALGNGNDGLYVQNAPMTTIGGTAASARNVISGNANDEITTFGSGPGLLIQGNDIGTDITGTKALGNGGIGINASFPGITIGGLAPGSGNVIANSGIPDDSDRSGVVVSAADIPVLSNSIYDSQRLGIELTLGAASQAAPSLTSAVATATSSVVAGTLTSAAGTYTLQFFSTPGLDPSGHGEGETLLGTESVTVAGTSASFSEALPETFSPGSVITATATSTAGETSEFSPPITGVLMGAPPTITGDASSLSVLAGQQVTDTFTIANNSTVADAGVTLVDTLPAGVTFSSGAFSTGSPVVFSGVVATATIGSLAGGASATVSIVLDATASAVPSFTNVAEVTATTPGVAPGADATSLTTDVAPAADLSVLVSGPSGPVPVGQSLTYTVAATNKGRSAASGVTLTDTLPAGVTFVSASAGSGPAPAESSGTVTDAIGPLASGASVSVQITVVPTASAASVIDDAARVSGVEADLDASNNEATFPVVVTPVADLAILSDTASPGPVPVGGTVTFTVVVANDGPSPATGASLADTLPSGLTFVSGTADGGLVVASGGLVTAPIGAIPDGGRSTVTIVATAATAGTFADQATVSSPVEDPTPGNNTGGTPVVVTPLADLAVSIGTDLTTYFAGQALAFTGRVVNNGPSPATGVVLTDALPAGLIFQSATAGSLSGAAADGVVTLPIGDLVAGALVTFVLTVVPTQAGSFIDNATVAATEPDPDESNNSAGAVATVNASQALILFSAPNYTVTEDAGTAAITLTRSGDTQSDVTVRFSTVAGGDATPGLDYEPVSAIVDFPAGVTQATAVVPVLADPLDNHDELVVLQLDSPTGDAALEAGPPAGIAPATATLTIIDLDPNLVGPTVTDLRLIGPVAAITSIEIDTTGRLDPTTAADPANYTITALGGGGKKGIPAGAVVPVVRASYNASTGAVTLTPMVPLTGNELFSVRVNGTRPGAVTDLAGNPLNSVLGTTPASDYLLTVARGTNITYADENGTAVNFKLSGPGTIDIDRLVTGQLERLQIVGGVAKKTSLSGSVHGKVHRTTVGTILGLDRFGTILSKLKTPPFYVTRAVPY